MIPLLQHQATSSCAIGSNSLASTEHFLTYVNPVDGLKMDYPSSWNIYRANSTNEVYLNIHDFVPTKENVDLERTPRVTLRITTPRPDLEPQLSIGYIAMKIDIDKRIYHGFNLTGLPTPTTIAGNPAYRIAYSFIDQAGASRNRMDVYFAKDDKIYEIQYDTASALYCKYLAVVLKMISSLQINKLSIQKMIYCLKLNTTNDVGYSMDNVTHHKYIGCDFNKTLKQEENTSDNPSHLLFLGDIFHNKGGELSNLGNFTGAIKYYDKALAIQPNDVKTLYDKGNALNNLGNFTGAIKYYDKALAGTSCFNTI